MSISVLLAIDAAKQLDDRVCRPAIVWRLCTATARVRAAFALTISGGSVLCAAMAKPGTLRSSTIIEERRHEHQA